MVSSVYLKGYVGVDHFGTFFAGSHDEGEIFGNGEKFKVQVMDFLLLDYVSF